MKKWTSKLLAALLAVVMVVSSITPTALAAPKAENKSESAALENVVFEDRTEEILKAAKAMAVYSELVDSLKDEETSPEKEAVKDVIFHSFNAEEDADLSQYDISAKEMDKLTEEVLEENNMENSVEVTYETDAADEVTTVSVEMDSVLAMAAEEAAATGLTQAEKDDIVARYAAYQKSMVSMTNPETGEEVNVQDLFGVQTPYFTSKDTDACPIGSLLSIAGIPNSVLEYGLEAIVSYGIMDYATITGILDLFTYANQFAVMLKADAMGDAIEDAMTEVYTSGADTTEETLLVITNWLAQNCTFDMPYIMEMKSPVEDTTSDIAKDRQTIYTQMYDNIKGMVYQQVYDQVYAQVYDQVYNQVYEQVFNLTFLETEDEAIAAQAADAEAKPQAETYAAGYAAQYMDAPTEDGSDNGAASAMTLAASIINLWEGNHVGVLTYGTAVCLGYSNAFTLLVQHAFPSVYREGGKQDGAWRPYEELNGGTNGNWEAMVDYVRISFDTEVTMFGVTQDDFTSDHYWNAVKVNGKWYYVDPCYVDVFVEVMARDRVETNGNINYLYFLFSHDAAEELYEGYYSLLDTLYADIATDRTYEDAWFAFMKSPVYIADNYYYYLYDSTDMIEMNRDSENMSQETIEYKIVRTATNTGMKDTGYDEVLVDFTYQVSEGNEQQQAETYAHVLNPKTGKLEPDALVQELYEKHTSYQEDYASLVITTAYHNGKIYFNLANCILTYDVKTGAVERVYEYNEVHGVRDMQKAFGGMAFTTTTNANGADVSVENPPIAGFTVKGNTMYVDIATSLGFISGKDRDNMDDPSNYGYEFEETNYNQEYLYASYLSESELNQAESNGYHIDTDNDNDEFMWSANITDTVNLNCSHSYGNVSIDETCTTAAFTERRCTKCGYVESSGMQKTTLSFNVVDTNGEKVDKTIESIETETLERNFSADAFSYDNAKANVEKVLKAGEYLAIEMPETVEWSKSATATVIVEAEDNQAEDLTKLDDVTLAVEFVHEHTDACHTKVDCGLEESEDIPAVQEHKHDTDCYISETPLCGEEHEHVTACYASDDPLCGLEESEGTPAVPGHKHDETCHTVADCGVTAGTISTSTLTRKMPEDATTYTFDGDEIASYVPGGYKVSGTVADATVGTGVDASKKTVNVVKDADTANLQVIFKVGDVELESVLLSNTTGTNSGVTFTASQITAEIPTGYEATATVEDVTVAFGAKETVTVIVQEVRATATLNIKVTGADSPAALTKKGVKGKTVAFTAAEIIKAITVPEGYAITSIVSDRAVIYGESETINVTVASTAEVTEGKGHRYVEFKETYYTRVNEDDPNSAFKTGTCYVCIDCKDAVDEKPADAEMYTLSNKNLTNIWTWAVDYAAASLYEIPTALNGVLLDCVWENAGLGSKRSVATVTGPVESGTCTSGNGINYKYTAKTADGKTDVRDYNVKYDNHLYSDEVISFKWADDKSTCTASYECIRCHATGSSNCTVEKRDVVASCTDDAATIYTAKITLAGVPYSNQEKVLTGDKAYGHDYDEKYDICQNCGMSKPESVITLPDSIKVSYTGKASAAVNGVKAETIVEGSTGKVSRTYYSDKACTKKVTLSTGASKAGYAPSKMGIYYVKVTVQPDDNYKGTTSKVCKLTIAPNKISGLTRYNTASGIYLKWKKVPEATGYGIYRRIQNDSYEFVKSITKNTTLNWTDTTAVAGKIYEYDVRPFYKTSSGTKIYSIANMIKGYNAARTRVSVSRDTEGMFVEWDAVYNATGYVVYRKLSSADTYSKLTTVGSSKTSFVDKTAKNGKTYKYYVKPTGKVTTRSSIFSAYCLEAPEISKISSPKASQIKVTWDKNSKATSYQIRYSRTEDFAKYSNVSVSSGSTVSKTFTAPSAGKEYYVKVRAIRKSGSTTYYSGWSDTVSVTTKK